MDNYRDFLLQHLEYSKIKNINMEKKENGDSMPMRGDRERQFWHQYWDNTIATLMGTCYSFSAEIPSEEAKHMLNHIILFNILDALYPYETHRSKLAQYELRYTLSGKARLIYRGKTYILTAGQGYFIDNREEHYYAAEPGGWSSTILHFNGPIVQSIYERWVEGGNVIFSGSSCPEFEMNLYEVIKMYQQTTPFKEYKVSCLLDILLTNLLQRDVRHEEEKDALIRNVLDYIQTHYAEKITCSDLCNRFFISSAKLNRDFRKYTNQTPKNYLLNFRLAKATALLANSTLSIQEIALQTGFTDYAGFVASFKKSTGMVPSKYRNLNE